MTRITKLRGYNENIKKWLYGFYIHSRGSHFIYPDEFENGKNWDDYKVNPKTVGQFTNLHDKNGKEIYEFDVVRNKWGGIGVIVFYNGSWSIEWGEDETHILFYELDDEIEVIGNKFDNQELLEGGEES